jgi:hypothetical protein
MGDVERDLPHSTASQGTAQRSRGILRSYSSRKVVLDT